MRLHAHFVTVSGQENSLSGTAIVERLAVDSEEAERLQSIHNSKGRESLLEPLLQVPSQMLPTLLINQTLVEAAEGFLEGCLQ